MHKVSIIVPVYNTENYLERCLNSIINQSYHNIEIILINDGSTDKSKNICNEYASKDNRIKVIHQTNKGVSYARNAGLDSATGNYVMFIDSDDELCPNAINNLLAPMLENSVDIVTGGVGLVYDSDRVESIYNRGVPNKVFDNTQGIENILLRNTAVFSFARLYNKNVFKGTRYNSNITINEDRLFVFEAFSRASSSLNVDNLVYYYHQIGTSTTHSGFTLKYFDIILVNDIIFKKVCVDYPSLVELAETDRLYSLMWLFKTMTLSVQARSKYEVEYNKLRDRIISNDLIQFRKSRDKLNWLILKYVPIVYIILILFMTRLKFTIVYLKLKQLAIALRYVKRTA
jgi:glycosyltransferase involved in cell wall biosynthesis